eukprot:TRINITY_DN11101_c0_g1_i1.p1 TRINITY_DN11101_c0_g1~~TRINITY_DN11101_c0_g1_i1.p1  ORF type:complete len:356 (-),score=67.40 TRINITY_DN11101_c0_g1_i1:52-1035(-)
MSGYGAAQKLPVGDFGASALRDLSGAKRKRSRIWEDEPEHVHDDQKKRAESFAILRRNVPKRSRPDAEVSRADVNEKCTGGNCGFIRTTGEEVSVVGNVEEEAHPVGIVGAKRKRRSTTCDECESTGDLDHVSDWKEEHACLIDEQPLAVPNRKFLKHCHQKKRSKPHNDFASVVQDRGRMGNDSKLPQGRISADIVSADAESLASQSVFKMNPLNFPLWHPNARAVTRDECESADDLDRCKEHTVIMEQYPSVIPERKFLKSSRQEKRSKRDSDIPRVIEQERGRTGMHIKLPRYQVSPDFCTEEDSNAQFWVSETSPPKMNPLNF